MDAVLRFGIFGDSLMKGTLPAEGARYAFHREFMDGLLSPLNAAVANHAHFGATIRKGMRVVQRDLARGSRYDYALVEYGGNDCNYDWPSIARDPAGAYDPAVLLPEFTQTLGTLLDTLQASGVRPVLMTLPPIDAEKYLDYMQRGGIDREAVLLWLGDAQHIYRTQELYSDAVFKTAVRRDLTCVDARAAFLAQTHFPALISDDGIHPSEAGYHLLYETLIDGIRTEIANG